MLNFPDLGRTPKIDKVGVHERVNRFCKRSIKASAKIHGLHLALSMIDLTTLEGKDTPRKVIQLCYKAQHLHDSMPILPTVAAVCVYPTFVGVAKKELKGSGVNVASASTAFSTNSFTTEAGLFTTSPAAIWLATWSDN